MTESNAAEVVFFRVAVADTLSTMTNTKSFNANPDRSIIDLKNELSRMDSIERSWLQRVVGIAQQERTALTAILGQQEPVVG